MSYDRGKSFSIHILDLPKELCVCVGGGGGGGGEEFRKIHVLKT